MLPAVGMIVLGASLFFEHPDKNIPGATPANSKKPFEFLYLQSIHFCFSRQSF